MTSWDGNGPWAYLWDYALHGGFRDVLDPGAQTEQCYSRVGSMTNTRALERYMGGQLVGKWSQN